MSRAVRRLKNTLVRKYESCILNAKEHAEYCVDGVEPLLVLAPTSEQDVSGIVQSCSENQALVVVAGNGRRFSHAKPHGDRRPVVVISTQRMNQVIQFNESERTITVQSGLALARLQEIAEEHLLHLPVEITESNSTTLGATVATDAIGPRCLRHGSAREYLLGATMIMGDGSRICLGSHACKTLSDYDMTNSIAGSFGSLGIITSLTLRLRPLPQEFRLIEVLIENVLSAEYIIGQLLRHQVKPSMIELLNAPAAKDWDYELDREQMLLLVGFEDDCGNHIDSRIDELRRSFDNDITVHDLDESVEEYSEIVEWFGQDCAMEFEARVNPRDCGAVVSYCAKHGVPAISHAGSGVVYGRSTMNVDKCVIESILEYTNTIGQMRLQCSDSGSFAAIQDNSEAWKEQVKQRFDPFRVFPSFGLMVPTLARQAS